MTSEKRVSHDANRLTQPPSAAAAMATSLSSSLRLKGRKGVFFYRFSKLFQTSTSSRPSKEPSRLISHSHITTRMHGLLFTSPSLDGKRERKRKRESRHEINVAALPGKSPVGCAV